MTIGLVPSVFSASTIFCVMRSAVGFSPTIVQSTPTPSYTQLNVFTNSDRDIKVDKFRDGIEVKAATSGGTGSHHKSFSTGGPSEELLHLFNEQVTNEFIASHMYLSASIWFETHDFEGMARYMRTESSDERSHALSLIDFANKRSIPIQLQGIPSGDSSHGGFSSWSSPENIWQSLLKVEQDNTQSLLKLAETATQCQDYAVLAFLNPFHLEQIDSEAKIQTILAKVKDEQKTPGLVRQLDSELGQESASA
jgi:ferritin